jgi:hypothetical protein
MVDDLDEEMLLLARRRHRHLSDMNHLAIRDYSTERRKKSKIAQASLSSLDILWLGFLRGRKEAREFPFLHAWLSVTDWLPLY